MPSMFRYRYGHFSSPFNSNGILALYVPGSAVTKTYTHALLHCAMILITFGCPVLPQSEREPVYRELEVDGKPVRKCLHLSTHACRHTRTYRWTNRSKTKHNASIGWVAEA